MAGRVKLPTTIDRRREAWMAFPGLSPNHCYVMCSSNMQGEGGGGREVGEGGEGREGREEVGGHLM